MSKLLLIDDEADVQYSFQRIFNSPEIELTTASSGEEGLKIIPKLYKYQRVYVTEHYPADTKEIVPNRDKIHGADIRLYDNSGVYLDLPPFNLPSSMLELILEVRAGDFGDLYEGGWIRTYMLKPT